MESLNTVKPHKAEPIMSNFVKRAFSIMYPDNIKAILIESIELPIACFHMFPKLGSHIGP